MADVHPNLTVIYHQQHLNEHEHEALDLVDHPPRHNSTSATSNTTTSSQDHHTFTNMTDQPLTPTSEGLDTSLQSSQDSHASLDSEASLESQRSQDLDQGSNMKLEQHRLASFRHPSWTNTFMDPHILARDGFYYFGSNDHAKCAFCGITIGEWSPGDDPHSDHRRWSPRCPYIKGFNVGNVPIGDAGTTTSPSVDLPWSQDTCGRYNIEIMPNSLAEQGGGADPRITNGTLSLSELGIDPTNNGPVYKDFNTTEARMRSFKEWPVSMRQKPNQLAASGFFYTGKGDQTLCFYCGGGLKDWEENDDPWEQHAKWFSKCTFVILNKGHDYIREVGNRNPPKITPKEAITLANSCVPGYSGCFNSVNSIVNASGTPVNAASTPVNSVNATTLNGGASNTNNTLNTNNLNNNRDLVPNSEQMGSVESVAPSTTVSGGVAPNQSSLQCANSSKLEKLVDNKMSLDRKTTESEKHLCKICYEEELSIVLLPCKHMFACVKCCTALDECAVCRKPFTAMIRAYVS